eukprot:5160102-Amphidinium_carterae.1
MEVVGATARVSFLCDSANVDSLPRHPERTVILVLTVQWKTWRVTETMRHATEEIESNSRSNREIT